MPVTNSRFNSPGGENVLGGEGNCLRGTVRGGNISGGNVNGRSVLHAVDSSNQKSQCTTLKLIQAVVFLAAL